ncbi:MAG: DMT family transporter [Phormidesmis sp.]
MSATTAPRKAALGWGTLAALTWGLTGTFIKLLPSFTTLEVLAIRLLLAMGVTLVLFALQPSLFSKSIALIRQPVGVLLASLMLFYYLFAVRAFQLAPVSDVALTVGLSPLIALAASAIRGKALALSEILGASIAFIGLALFVGPKIQGISGDRTLYITGLFFALMAACVSLGYATLFERYAAHTPALSPIVVSCTTFIIGAAIMTPTIAIRSPTLFVRTVQPETLKIALGLGILSTVVPTFCYSYAAKYLPPVLTTTLNLLVPVFAAILAFFVIGETMPTLSMVGASLIIVGIVALSISKPPSRPSSKPPAK